MLATLSVQNFAIIDNITVNFKSGLTIITGETGAGKSLIIDAIGLLLGERASASMVRSGFPKAVIEGVFTGYNEKVAKLLDDYGIDEFDHELLVKKEISSNGKSLTRINGNIVTIAQLSEIANQLADIHTQEDTRMLFQPKAYLDFIETPSSKILLVEYQKNLKIYLEKIGKYEKLKKRAESDADQIDFYSFRNRELKNAKLKSNEEDEIDQELNFLNNYENIFKNLSAIKQEFLQHNIIDTLYEMKQSLTKLSEVDNQYKERLAKFENLYYELADFESEINADVNHLEFDDSRLNELNERSSFLQDLKRRYHKTIPELIEYQKDLEERILEFESYDDIIKDAENDVIEIYQKLVKNSIELTNERIQNSKILKKEIQNTLKELHLEKVQFEIVFSKPVWEGPFDSKVFKTNGVDSIDIMISFNPGEALKELSKVASGGEMSRVMLALKAHLFSNMHLATMIFDEIDQGVSGKVAEAIALKLKKISHSTQVLAITHIPIVASSANQHLLIQKQVQSGRTFTLIKELTLEERIKELSKMIAPSSKDENVEALAISMIKQWT